jgi:malate permease and related proteins
VLIATMVLLGWLMRRFQVLPDSSAEVLNALVIKLCFPALVLSVVPKLTLSLAVLKIAGIAWLVMSICALLVHFLARAMRWKRDFEGCLLITAVLGNTAFLGYPLTQAYLGLDQLPLAVIYDQLGSFVVFSSFALWVAARFGGTQAPSLSQTLLRMLQFPAFLALCFGLSLSAFAIELPQLVRYVLDALAALLVPLAMLAVGLNLRLRSAAGDVQPLLFGLGIKMLLAPVFALGLAALLLPNPQHAVVVLQASMPPMATAAALAANANLRPNLAAAMAGFGVLIAMVWTPILLHLLP